MRHLHATGCALLLSSLLTACGGHDDPVYGGEVVTASTPNQFIQFLNTQAPLTSGEYTVVAATAAANQVDDYTLTVTYDDGTQEVITGSWTDSGGQDPLSADNPSHALTLGKPGGITLELNSAVDNYLYLLKNDFLVREDDNSGDGNNARIHLLGAPINSEEYATTYYDTVDPNNTRTTLEDWKTTNGFDAGAEFNIRFRDAKDLGYGRNMYARQRSDGGFAVYVENYFVKLFNGDPDNYGPLNLEAMIVEDHRFLLGANAIEFSPIDENDSGSVKIAKFFTFAPESELPDAPLTRVIKANLDGRGAKFMPQICQVCHGGSLYPLNTDGTFRLESLLAPKMNQLELETFEYAGGMWSKAAQEEHFRQFNAYVHATFDEMNSRVVNDTPAHWAGDFAKELTEGRYACDFSDLGLCSDTYVDDEVPAGWRQDGNRPEGVEQLFKKVVEPHCIACHSLRGTTAAKNATTGDIANIAEQDPDDQSFANAINFSTYEEFHAYNDKIIDYVYLRGVMPLSLLNWRDFWDNPTAAPTLLASFLDGFDRYDASGNVIPPGMPYAKPGANRSAASPVQLDGNPSLFAETYQWEVVSAPAASVSGFSDANVAAPVFTADTHGTYTLRLTVTNDLGSHSATTLLQVVNSAAFDQRTLNFVDDIRPILGSDDTSIANNCSRCHNAATGKAGVPVYYDDSNPRLYLDVLERVDFRDPENSILLRKPTSFTHGGGMRINLDTIDGREKYNTLLNWIREGAVCGDDPTWCD